MKGIKTMLDRNGFKDFSDFKRKLSNKKIAILGFGVSNKPLYDVIKDFDCEIIIRDKNEIPAPLKEEMLKKGNVRFIEGENYLNDIDEDIIFRSPGIMPTNPQIKKAVENGAYLTSEMEAFLDMCPATTIGITGSDGKTTTTTLISLILKKAGFTVHIGGNIGSPLIDKLGDIKESDMVVLELSSFQLMTMKKSTDISVITNLAPNHLDKHTDMEEYISAKTNIFSHGCKKLILNSENEITKGFITPSSLTFSLNNPQENGAYLKDGKIYFKNEYIMDKDDIVIPGIHNVDNYLAAICAVSGLCDFSYVKEVATEFGGVEHRIEFFKELNGVRYYNDSIASSPTRTIAGLNSFNKKVILIAGGSDKYIPFDTLAKKVITNVKELIVMGATKDKIKNAVIKEDSTFPIYEAKDLKDAVMYAKKTAVSGDIVLLSPACASFDCFKNFADRGNQFKELVNQL